jgi:adenine-specific DNA-methyltransferase
VRLVHQIWLGKSEEKGLIFQKKRNIAAVITDPPFGTDNQSNMAVTEVGKKYARKIANDESPEIAIANFKRVMDVILPGTKDEADCYIFTSYQVLSDWLVMTDEYMPKHGFKRNAILIWEKDGPGMGDTECPWGMGLEFVLFFQKGRREKTAVRRNAVMHVPQLRPNQLIHPHEKPTNLLERYITASTKEGDLVVDPFGGSGSLARAARNVNRSCVAIESDKENYDLAMEALNSREESLFS